MLAYIKGKLAYQNSESAVIEVGGIGYRVFMSGGNLNNFGRIGEEVQVFTYLQVREDVLNLYGFITSDELHFFELLLQVSGIGPKLAQAVLGAFSLEILQKAILEENIALLAKAPGIGKKMAQRMVLELKDKLSKLMFTTPLNEQATIGVQGSPWQDALSALESLGYSTLAASQVLDTAMKELGDKATVEALIKTGLKQLAQT